MDASFYVFAMLVACQMVQPMVVFHPKGSTLVPTNTPWDGPNTLGLMTQWPTPARGLPQSAQSSPSDQLGGLHHPRLRESSKLVGGFDSLHPVDVVLQGLPEHLLNLPVPAEVINEPFLVTEDDTLLNFTKSPLPLKLVKRAVTANVANTPLLVAVANKTLPVELSNLPVPVVVVNQSLPVTIKDTSLNFTLADSFLPVGVINRTLTVDVGSLPLPVAVVNKSIPVDLSNLPLPVVVSNSSLPVTIQNTPLNFTVMNSLLPVGIVNRTLTVEVASLPLPVAITNSTLPVELSKLPLPVVVTNESLPVTISNNSLNVSVLNSLLPVAVVNRTLTVDVASLPLPVGIVNQTLNVNVGNLPLRTTVDQPVEVTSTQLMANLTAIDVDVRAIQTLLQNMQLNTVSTGKRCPEINGYGIICYPAATSCFCVAFADAVTFCKNFGFDGLVSLQTKAKSFLIVDLFQTSGLDVWTSGSKSSGSSENFVWTTTGDFFTETLWNPGEPASRASASCVKILSNGLWASVLCTDKPDGFICELTNVNNPVG